MDMINEIDDIDDAALLAPILVAALSKMGAFGREGAEALIDEMEGRGNEFEEEDRGNVGEAVSWLSTEVSERMDFAVG